MATTRLTGLDDFLVGASFVIEPPYGLRLVVTLATLEIGDLAR
jgi:hypothetical protein